MQQKDMASRLPLLSPIGERALTEADGHLVQLKGQAALVSRRLKADERDRKRKDAVKRPATGEENVVRQSADERPGVRCREMALKGQPWPPKRRPDLRDNGGDAPCRERKRLASPARDQAPGGADASARATWGLRERTGPRKTRLSALEDGLGGG